MIPLHKTYFTGKEKEYISNVIDNGMVSGNGEFTAKCHQFFESRFGFPKVLLTNSCTSALEMCSLILELQPGDEILVPSYTFVSTVNAFHNFGIQPVFCDSLPDNPNVDTKKLENKITQKTKAVIVMHYAGIGCNMNEIMELAQKHHLYVIEDAALGLGSYYNDKPLGGFGDLAAFSFHQTKNITCGEGGLLVINNESLKEKAEIVWEKGTNRAAFLRGETDKYEWVSKGASYLTSEIHAACLFGQLESFDFIQNARTKQWEKYYQALQGFDNIILPEKNNNVRMNGSIFYFLFKNSDLTGLFIQFMHKENISVSTHYRTLHNSNYFKSHYKGENLINCGKIAHSLIRLPLFTELSEEDQQKTIDKTTEFLNNL